MRKLVEWFRQWSSKPEPCNHAKNWRQHNFTAGDGTPMMDWQCLDCGLRDHGHVYAAPGDSWPDETITFRDGVRVEP